MLGDLAVVNPGLLVDLLLPVVELLLQLLFFLCLALVPRLSQQVIDGVLLRLVEAEIELRLRFLDARVFLFLDRRVVLLALLGISRDRLGRRLQLGPERLELYLRLRRLEPLLRALAIGLEMALVQLEELALVVLPRPARDHFVVHRPRGAQSEQDGEADERPLERLQLEGSGRHVVKYSGCSG